MLPVETFGEVASFLGYYDLAGLKMATKLLSSVANQCADAIRLFDFSDIKLQINDFTISVYRFDSNNCTQFVCGLGFGKEKKMAEFISDAFRNCIVRRLVLLTSQELVLNALKAVANAVAVAELRVGSTSFENVQWLVDIADSFRGVKFLGVTESLCRDEEELVKDFCQMKRIVYE